MKRSAANFLDEIAPQREGGKGEGKEVEYEAEKPFLIRVKEWLFNRYMFRHNVITDVQEFSEDEGRTWQPFQEDHLNTVWIELQLSSEFGAKEKPGIKLLERLLKSSFVPRFHAVTEYLDGLKWDGQDHISTLAKTVTVEDIALEQGHTMPGLWPALFRRWLIAAAACAAGRSPNHVMLLLIGNQGTFKTTWLNRLCPEALADYRFTGHINPDLTDNTTANLLAEKVFLNIDDQLESIFEKDFNKVKSIITIDYINNRKAYRRDDKRRPRIANVIGSVNRDRIFLDVENRRYLTFKVKSIAISDPVNYEQVWAQAWHLFRKGERHWFDGKEVAQLNVINNAFSVNTPELEWLQRCYTVAEETDFNSKWVMFNEILTTLSSAAGKNLRDGHLRNAIKKLEWPEPRSKRTPDKNYPVYAYCVREHFLKNEFGKIGFPVDPALQNR